MEERAFWSPAILDLSSGSASKYMPASWEVTLTSDPLASHLRAELKSPRPALAWWGWRGGATLEHRMQCSEHKDQFTVPRGVLWRGSLLEFSVSAFTFFHQDGIVNPLFK